MSVTPLTGDQALVTTKNRSRTIGCANDAYRLLDTSTNLADHELAREYLSWYHTRSERERVRVLKHAAQVQRLARKLYAEGYENDGDTAVEIADFLTELADQR